MDGVLPIVFLAVILKIPVIFAIWLIWWAAREEPELEDLPGEDHSFKRWRRDPTRPGGPRKRDPHGGGAALPQPDCPPGGRQRTPVVQPRLAPGMAAHERREHTPAGS